MPEVPDFIRKAMEAQGVVDPDYVAEASDDPTVISSDEAEMARQSGSWRDELDTAPPPVDEPETLPSADQLDIGLFSDPARSGAAGTQLAAAVAVYPGSGTARRKVLDFIGLRRDQGATDEEIEIELRMRHQTASARRNELTADGWIEDSGRRRPTTSGREAVVWVLSDLARGQWRPAA